MVKRVVVTVFVLAGLMLPMAAGASPSAESVGSSDGGKPSRVLMVVIDAFRPGYIERFDMKNVKALMDRGTSSNGIVGHMAAETVISHNVMTSGLFPSTWAGPTRSTGTWTTRSAREPGPTTSPAACRATSSRP